jgi:phage gp29-like protein
MKFVMDAKFYGWTAIQLGDIIDDRFTGVEKIPEENQVPYFDAMIKNANMSFIPGGDNTINFADDPYDTWVVRTGSKTDLGLINKCAPYIIWKQVFGSWSQHAGVFGMPLRVGKTSLADNERRQNLINAFEAATGAAYIIQDLMDEVQVIEQKGGSDPHQIYGQLIEKCDQAISKIVLSQTGTTDEKAFAGSADVHAQTQDDIIFSDKLDIKAVVNELLIPRMKKIGMISESKNIYGGWDHAEKMSIEDWAKTFLTLSQAGYSVPADEVKRRTGIEVDETVVAVPENKTFSIMNKIDKLYGKDNS